MIGEVPEHEPAYDHIAPVLRSLVSLASSAVRARPRARSPDRRLTWLSVLQHVQLLEE